MLDHFFHKFSIPNAVIKILAVGGSVTCAAGMNRAHPGNCRNMSCSWSIQLGSLFQNVNFAANGIKFESRVMCVYAVGAGFWINEITRNRILNNKDHAVLSDADLIIFDTAVNDDHMDPYRAENYEILIRMILSLPKAPLMIYLGVSNRPVKQIENSTCWFPKFVPTDNIYVQLKVGAYY